MADGLERWIADEMMRFSFLRHPPVVLDPLVEYKTPREIMAELREADPEAAMLLGEYIVVDEPGEAGQP